MPRIWPVSVSEWSARVGEPLGQAEVGHERRSGRVDQDVRRLQVAVQDAVLVGVVDGAGDVEQAGDLGRARRRGCLAREAPSMNFMEKYCWPSCSPTS